MHQGTLEFTKALGVKGTLFKVTLSHSAIIVDRILSSKSLPSSNHILLAKALYFARQCSNSHTCALACHKYIALDGVATRIENQQNCVTPGCFWMETTSKMTMMQRPRSLIRPYLEQQCPHRPRAANHRPCAANAVEGGASVVEASN